MGSSVWVLDRPGQPLPVTGVFLLPFLLLFTSTTPLLSSGGIQDDGRAKQGMGPEVRTLEKS